jgi:hypothetical protein
MGDILLCPILTTTMGRLRPKPPFIDGRLIWINQNAVMPQLHLWTMGWMVGFYAAKFVAKRYSNGKEN